MNPTKLQGTEKFTPRMGGVIAGWRKDDSPVEKKLPVEVDVSEQMARLGNTDVAPARVKAIGDLALMAFYFLLRVGEYTVKAKQNSTKQTQQFRVKDVRFFVNGADGMPRQLPPDAPDSALMSASSVTLRLRNQKNGWKNVCIHQEANGCAYFCGVKAAARRAIHIRRHTSSREAFLSAYWEDGAWGDITDDDMRRHIKAAAKTLRYEEVRGIREEDVDTHSLRSGGANALHMAGYSDRQIMKTGRWKSKTFLEYIREELGCFAEGMSKNMKRVFKFANVRGDRWTDVTDAAVISDCASCDE